MNIFTVSKKLILGRQTESGITTIQFPIKHYVEKYGTGGHFYLQNKRPVDENAYLCVITSDENYVYWTPREVDLAYEGKGEAQLNYAFGEPGTDNYRNACSEVFDTYVERSIEPGADAPAPYTPWVTQVEGYATRAEEAKTAAETAQTAAEQAAEEAQSAVDEGIAQHNEAEDAHPDIRQQMATLEGDIPTKTSDLSNDSGFITNTVENLANYYKKTETYTQTEVNDLISAIKTMGIKYVDVLPTASASTMGDIYLVPSAKPSTQDEKDEFITIQKNSTYKWEHIGSTAVDLTDYAKKEWVQLQIADFLTQSEIESLISSAIINKVDKVAGKGLSTNDFTNAEKTKLAGIEAGAEVNPTNVSAFENDAGYLTEHQSLDAYRTATQQDEIDAGKVPTTRKINNKPLTADINLVPADLGIGSVFTLKGSKQTYADLPTSGNVIGDVWYIVVESVGYIWLNDGTTDRWEKLGMDIDLSAYRTSAQQDVIDNGKLSTSGDGSNVTAAFTQASTRANIATGEKLSVLFGKIKKWFADLKTVAFSGSYDDLSDTPTNVSDFTNDAGYLTEESEAIMNLASLGLSVVDGAVCQTFEQ